MIAGAGSDYANLIGFDFLKVERCRFGIFFQFCKFQFQISAQHFRVCGYADIFLCILHIFADCHFLTFAAFHDGFAMTDTGRHTDHNGCVILLTELVAFQYHVTAFLAVCRLKHRDFCGFRIVAVILFILCGMLARLVCGNNNRTAVNASIGKREERVCRYVQSHMLHRCHRPTACDRCTNRRFQSHLFIGCPFGTDFLVLGKVLQDFR